MLMKRLSFAALAAILLLLAGLWWRGTGPLTQTGHSTEDASIDAPASQTVVAPSAPTTASRSAVPALDTNAWTLARENEKPFADFAHWVHNYDDATPSARLALEPLGIQLATERRRILADLIQADPERALQLAVPFEVRERMPTSVQGLFEERVNARGNYSVLAVRPLPGQEREVTPVLRTAVVEGTQYQIYTYGDALDYLTRTNAPLNGIALPMSAATAPPVNLIIRPQKLMALDPNPVRRLSPAEVARSVAPDPICSTSGANWDTFSDPIAVQLGGDIHTFCGKLHAEDYAAAGIAAAGLATAQGVNVPTSESSYTEGRKRMLCLRPYWSDYTTMMTTNEALTHWVAFSNYMHEMSYGKLVFAPLGKGSLISPEILMPGSVSGYSSGLDTTFTTVKEVARTNYSIDLSQFDFIYYCTKAQPAASYAGLGYVGGVGFHLANGYFNAAVSSHEFGHNLGLNHAHFWRTEGKSIIGSGQNVEYGDNNDPMGSGGSPNSYNSRYKNYLGWIGDADITDLNITGSGVYRLYSFDLGNSVGLRGLKFRRNSTQNYWVNFRQRKTSKKALMNGVQLLWTGNGNQGSYLLDTQLKDDSDDNTLLIGRTFSDPSINLHITPLGKGHTYPESIDVQVQIGSFPSNVLPTVRLTSTATNVGVGQPIIFTASASDANGDALAYSFDFGDGDYSVESNPVASHGYSAAGSYTVQCLVSDMKGGVARQSLVVRVGTTTTYQISGRVFDEGNRPLAGVRVSAGAGRVAYSDSDGSYVVSGLPAGAYNMVADEVVSGALSFVTPFFSNPVTVGPNFNSADFIGVAGSLNIYDNLVGKGASWKYLHNGVDQGTAWRNAAFNDGSWAGGLGPLGYPSGAPITTVIGYGPSSSSKYITYYFRKQFVVQNPAAYTNLLLEVLRDDGVAVYLNGSEVYRNNLPSGTLTYGTLAIDTVEPDSYLQATLSKSLLLTGTNLITAEVHQVSQTSSDIAFDLGLSGLSVSNASGFNLVYVSNPPNQAVFTNGTLVNLAASAMSGGSTVSEVEFQVNGATLSVDSSAPYTGTWVATGVGNHVFRAIARIGSQQITSPPVNVTIAAPVAGQVSETLVAANAVWRYLAGPAAAPANWAAAEFNDSAWPSGPAKLGFGDGDEATVIPGGPSNARFTTVYFRRSFQLQDPGAVSNLTVQLRRDDGAIVYLNGVEIVRDNIAPGPVNYGTYATNAADDGVTFFSFPIDPSLLLPGSNQLAAEVHQSSATSSDLTFVLALEAFGAAQRPRGVYLTAPLSGVSVPATVPIVLKADAVAGGNLSIGRVEFFTDDLFLGGTTNYPFRWAWTNPSPGMHQLKAVAYDSSGQSVVGSNVTVTVTPPQAAMGVY